MASQAKVARALFAAVSARLVEQPCVATPHEVSEFAFRAATTAIADLARGAVLVKVGGKTKTRVLKPGKLVERALIALKFGARPAAIALHAPQLKTQFDWKAVASELEAAAKAKGADTRALLEVFGVVPPAAGRPAPEAPEVPALPTAAEIAAAARVAAAATGERLMAGEHEPGTLVESARELNAPTNGGRHQPVL